MDCPKCRAANPDSSRFCGACAAPLPDSGSRPGTGPTSADSPDAPSLTTTIDPVGRGLTAGTVVAGKYRILGQIGRGGMGVVYEADDLKLRRAVALKFLPAELTDDTEARERFVHEAQAASILDNPHICTIHEIGESEDRRMFIAMTLCHGESLRVKVKRGPLPPDEALSIAFQVADGLAAAHAGGIVHRDIKPGNILVTKEGTARIADFGLAKIVGEARLTHPGKTVGTVAYMAPEQLRGDDVDARADVWALGVVLYEMLTGGLPFRGETEHSLAYAIVHGEPRPLSDLPPGTPVGCREIIERALAKDPSERFSSAVEMADALAAVREGAGQTGSGRTTLRDAGSRRPALVRIGIPVVLAAGLIYAVFALGIPRKVVAFLGLGPRAGEGEHITVFDPAVLAGSPEDRVLASGLAEYLRLSLERIARRSRSWVTPVEHHEDYEVREAADALRILGSNLVVSGTLKRSGDNLTLTLDVIDPVRLSRLGSLSKSDDVSNIATWQEDIVFETASALGLATAPDERAALAGAGTTVPGAFHAYLNGLGLMTSLAAGPGVDSPAIADSAIAALERAVGLDPSFAVAGIELAEAYRIKARAGNDPAMAARAESQVRAVLASNDGLAYGHHILGGILRGLGRNEEALGELEKARSIDPLSYDTLIRVATLYEEMNLPVQAEAAYRQALRIRPDYWAGLSYLGYFHFGQGDFDKARDTFEAVTRLCPGNINGLNNLGAGYFKLGDYDRAMAAFERSNAVKKNPESCSNLAVLYYYRGRYADAVTMNEAAIGFGPTEYAYLIWGNLADAYRFTPGNEGKAAEAYGRAIELVEKEITSSAGDPRIHSTLAVYLAKAGEAGRAVTEIEGALRALPDVSSIVLNAVLVFELTGARPRALEALRQYVRLKGPVGEIGRDPFLAGLRHDPDYADAVSGKPAGGTGKISDKKEA